ARVFWFKNDGADDIYLGSADWMKRNLRSRIEVSFPVYDAKMKKQIMDLLTLQLKDNTKAVFLNEHQDNIPVQIKKGEKPVNAQLDTYQMIKKWEQIE
ncbi:MAG: polyphosphate kinase 1, partial [Reichenbachiella sp.]